MKEQALAIARTADRPERRLNLLREYLQALTMRSLHESEAFTRIAFVGGTALRFAYGLGRYSEDLDFTLETPEGYGPRPWMQKIKRDLLLAGFDLSVTWNERKTVHTGWIRFAGVLKELGLSPMDRQNLSIKIEIDTNPPAGAASIRTVIHRHVMFALRHYDPASLMAGKLHALLTRKYAKGRDWYDLLWYLGQRPPVEPNTVLLQNALDQTGDQPSPRAADWRRLVREQIDTVDFDVIVSDVEPFLERPGEAALLTPEHLRSLL
ncbi:nucleotidyl transferase AbiEii/AbiGii toxin family protein [Kiritimatiella glycovorans]|uniref:Nucleotidyl transferase AbiEii/AbiGii toxin family protein n=1 Tax=Kiritimatiella glycovorans TaxID=1307763 RepID=A0A0G3EK58_9BACT|nr:nucleotidyl transferase AbiEii/AbiGii toxin family protein [Kiritimatiella glycovorans]AKJ64544.1 hypothetical protein L21SP4_01296 [Kiritimatiella glycovorans]